MAACRPDFQLKKFTTNEALYEASLREFGRRKWGNAITGFEKLTGDLNARDTLLTRAYWYLGRAHQEQREYLLAATAFERIVTGFPDDSLADDAALEQARSYWKLWRRPALDPTYGETALQAYNTLLTLYADPPSPLLPVARKEAEDLRNWFAIKEYDAGMYYFRDGAYDSAIIYFKTVLEKYPDTPKAREAGLRLVDAYRAIRYADDAREACDLLRARFADDPEVRRSCPPTPTTAAQPPPPAPPTH